MNDTILHQYTKHRERQRRSDATVLGEQKIISQFLRGVNIDIRSVTTSDISRYFAAARKRNLKQNTMHSIYQVLKCFFTHLVKERYILCNPFKKELFQQNKTRVISTVLSQQQVRDILFHLRKLGKLKLLAMVELLYVTGMRRSELVRLDISDINFKTREVYISESKTGRERLGVLPKATVQILIDYLVVRGGDYKGKTERALFVSQLTGKRLKAPTIGVYMYTLSRILGMKFTPHTFRRSIATHLMQRGMNILEVQKFLGHACIESTEYYTNVIIDDLQVLVQVTHPRGKMELPLAQRRLRRSSIKSAPW